jgi:hypothetical protein
LRANSLVIPIPGLMGVTGKVVDTEGNPISNAIVIVDKIGTRTGLDGSYMVPLITPGTYSFTVMKEGYVTVSGTVSVNPGQIVQKSVVLEKLPVPEVKIAPIVALALLLLLIFGLYIIVKRKE